MQLQMHFMNQIKKIGKTMVENIITSSVKKQIYSIVFVLVLTIGSFWAVKKYKFGCPTRFLSPPQVIIQVEWNGQSPKTIEEQISYPLISNLMSLWKYTKQFER